MIALNKENIRRRIRNITAFAAALLLAAAFTLPAGTEIMGDSFGNAIVASAAEEASGTCGTDLKWALDDAGTLTISYTGSGSGGSMQNWTYNDYCQRKIPWTNYQKSIKSVVIGDNVTSIGDYAFYSCSNITSVDMVSVTSIGQRAFSYCTSLSSITIPDSVTSIGGFAFSDCKSLSSITIPDSVTSIGELAFQMCTSLTSITIQSGVTSIGNGVFSNCNSLSNIIVDEGNTMFSSENGVLFDKNKTKLIRYPINKSGDSYDIPNSVTSIGVSAFASCKNLASITIPSSVTAIESEAFQECTSLTSITIPDSVTSIGDHAFESCSSLTSITIPNSVTSIGEFAFCECSSLTSITIPDSVNSIGDFAFYKCSSLTSITIPNSVTSIGNIAFESCSSLESIIIPKDLDITNSGIPASASQIKYSDDDEGNITITSVTLGEGKTSLTIPETIDGKSVSSIADTAFEKCEALESIIIPKDLDITTAGIPSSASQIKYTVDNENVIATVAALGSGQASLTIPDTIDGKNVTTVYIKDGTTVKAPASAAQIKYTVDNEGNITITSVTLGESQTSLTISETIGGKTVTSIENNALADCSNLESIIIPKDIDITNAGIPDTTTQIRYTVDNDNVTITAVTLVGDAADFVLPDKIGGKAVTNIADGALASCPNVSHEHREKKAATCTEKAVCAICETEYGETEAHNLNKHDAVPVSCTTDGNIEYYECNVCGKLFADENGEKETTLEAVMISAIGHSISHVYAKDPTCTEDGNNEHYKCSVCNMLFEDANGTTETTLDDVTIPAIGHNFGIACDSNAGGHYYVCTVCDEKSDIEEHIKDNGTVIKEATPTENGTITYKCIVCGAKAGEETITATISSFEVTSSGVVVKYTVTGSTEVKSQTLKFSEVTEEMVELMKSKNIQLVIDFVNYSTAGSDTIILTAAQMKAIEYVLAHDFVIES